MADQPAEAAPAAAAVPVAEDKIPLLEVLQDLGTTLFGHEVPTAANLGQTVGAIVKVLEHGGVTVADELWPPEPTVVARPETADRVHHQQTNQRLDRVEALLSDLHALISGKSQEPQP